MFLPSGRRSGVGTVLTSFSGRESGTDQLIGEVRVQGGGGKRISGESGPEMRLALPVGRWVVGGRAWGRGGARLGTCRWPTGE